MSEKSSASTEQHREAAAEQGPVKAAIVTVSDTRTPETDKNAVYLREQLANDGNSVTAYRIIKDEPDQVEAVLDEMAQTDARVILFNGGTGIAPRDTTFDVLSRKLEKTLPGFGNFSAYLVMIRSARRRYFHVLRRECIVRR